LAAPLVNTLYPQAGIFQALFTVGAAPKYPYAPLFLALTAAINLFILVGNISLSTFQSGIGKTMQIMYQSLLSLGIGLPLAGLMVYVFYSFGGSGQSAAMFAVIGGAVGTILASMPGMIWGLVWCYRKYHVKADFGVSAKIFAASAVAAAAAYGSIAFLSLPYFMLLIVGFVAFVLVYLALTPLLGAVNSVDIENFSQMFAGLGVVSKLLSLPFRYMRRFCRNKPKPA
jgi:hypothetical protein